MKRRMLIALAVFLALLGVASVGLADSGSRPFKGSESGTWQVVGECGPAGGPLGVPCTVIGMEGKIIATHLGKGRMEAEHESDWPAGWFDPGDPTGNTFCWPNVGWFKLIAANGDEVHGTYEGPLCADLTTFDLSGSATLVVTGGTGRFEGATGEIAASTAGGVSDIADPTYGEGTWLFKGWIGY